MSESVSLRRKMDRLLAEHKALCIAARQQKATLREVSKRHKALEEATALAQAVAQSIQTRAHRQISKIVSKCLDAVFDDGTTFRIDFERKRHKTEAKLLFLDGDENELDPLTQNGGGLIDVAALGLRLCAILLSKPQKRKLLVLDEPFKFVSEEFRLNLRTLLLSLAKDMKFQIVMTTHDKLLQCGTIVRIER